VFGPLVNSDPILGFFWPFRCDPHAEAPESALHVQLDDVRARADQSEAALRGARKELASLRAELERLRTAPSPLSTTISTATSPQVGDPCFLHAALCIPSSVSSALVRLRRNGTTVAEEAW